MATSQLGLTPSSRARRLATSIARPIPVAFTGPDERARELYLLLSCSRYQLQLVRDSQVVAERCQCRERWSVVLLACKYEEPIWRNTLLALRDVANPPFLITITDFEANQWSEMIREGVLDVLTDPLCGNSVIRLLDVAHRRWSRGCEQQRFVKLLNPVLPELE